MPLTTLADVLFADYNAPSAHEEQWVTLVQGIAAGDQDALHALYERTHRLVFTLTTRITNSREAAEEATVNVFCDVWRRSSTFDATDGTVLGWVMNQARAAAIEWLRSEQRKGQADPRADVTAISPADQLAFDTALLSDPKHLESAVRAMEKRDVDVIRPFASLWWRIARTIAGEPRIPTERWIEPDWREVAPGVSCKILASDARNHLVSMLVRLAPAVPYPPHRHAGVEELHLLQGDLWIDYRKLYPGDYHRAEPGSADDRVWSVTGCTCVLTTSTRDALR